jgi:hypothetical protein
VVAFIHDHLAVLGDATIHALCADQALKHGHVESRCRVDRCF